MFALIYINRILFGKPLRLIDPATIISNEVDYLIEHLKKREAIHRDIFRGKINEKELDLYASELARSIESLHKNIKEWIYTYTALPYEINIQELFEKLLIRALATENVESIINDLEEIKKVITGKEKTKEAQIAIIKILNRIHEENKEIDFLRRDLAREERKNLLQKILTGIVTLIIPMLTINDLITSLSQLKQTIEYTLPEMIYAIATTNDPNPPSILQHNDTQNNNLHNKHNTTLQITQKTKKKTNKKTNTIKN